MKILFVLENYYPHIGGVETLFHSLAHKLSDQNHQVVVLTTLKNKQDPTYEKIGDVQIYRKNYLNRYFFTFFAFFAAFRLAKDCDLIHTTSYNAALPAWLAGKLRCKKVLITFHEVWADLWFDLPFMSKIGASLHYRFEQLILGLGFHKFIGVSHFTEQALLDQGISKDRVAMIYNGIDYSEFNDFQHQVEAESFTFTFFGRLGMSKGIEILLSAIKIMPSSDRKIKYQLIIPTSPESFFKEINELIDKLQIRDKLILKHHLPFDQLKKEMAASYAIIIPSYSEGFCFAAVETMAIGTPIISSGRGALAEVVSGKFIQLGDLTPDALQKAMVQALNNQWEEIQFRKFHLKDTVDNYISLYQTSMID